MATLHRERGSSERINILSYIALKHFLKVATPIINNAISVCAVLTCRLDVRKTPNKIQMIFARIRMAPQNADFRIIVLRNATHVSH